jgi:hypothetical protein
MAGLDVSGRVDSAHLRHVDVHQDADHFQVLFALANGIYVGGPF